jgi:hypothetical protein
MTLYRFFASHCNFQQLEFHTKKLRVGKVDNGVGGCVDGVGITVIVSITSTSLFDTSKINSNQTQNPPLQT